jgi:kynurenine formamidase
LTTTPKRLYVGQPGTSLGTLYTVPANTKTIVKNIILTNTTGTAANVTIHFVPNGGSADATNKIISSYTVNTNDTVVIDLSSVLETGDTIQAIQGTANAITVYVSGVEVA